MMLHVLVNAQALGAITEFCKAQQDGTLDSKALREMLYTIAKPRHYM